MRANRFGVQDVSTVGKVSVDTSVPLTLKRLRSDKSSRERKRRLAAATAEAALLVLRRQRMLKESTLSHHGLSQNNMSQSNSYPHTHQLASHTEQPTRTLTPPPLTGAFQPREIPRLPPLNPGNVAAAQARNNRLESGVEMASMMPVSYTHLTLPTKRIV